METEIINSYKENLSIKGVYNDLDRKYTIAQIKSVIERLEDYQTNKPVKVNKKLFNPITVPKGVWFMDITFLPSEYASFNRGYGAILVIIEGYSRYLYAYPLKTKSSKEVSSKIEEFINTVSDNSILRFNSDAGSEFVNSDVEKILIKYHIDLIYYDKLKFPNHLSIVEAANKTLKNMIFQYLKVNDLGKRYIDDFDKIIALYNRHFHNTLKKSPDDVFHDNKTPDLNPYIKNGIIAKHIRDKFNIGDKIRVSENPKIPKLTTTEDKKDYNIFAKSDKIKFSNTIHEIKDITNTGVITDDNKIYKPYEIQKISKDTIIKEPSNKQKYVDKKTDVIKTKQKQDKVLKNEGIDIKNIISDRKLSLRGQKRKTMK
jgi:hypothetical protein